MKTNPASINPLPARFARLMASASACLLPALLTLAALAPIPAARAQVADHTLVGDRIVLSGSIKEVAPSAAAMKGNQASVVRTTLNAEELAGKVGFEVSLQMRDLASLDQRLAANGRLEPTELESHLPASTDYAAVEAWLTSQGFKITQRDGHRLALFASGTVAQAQAAFRVQFAQVAFKGENYISAVTAPSVPASLPAVLGVLGLQPFQKYHPMHTPIVNRPPGTSQNDQAPYYCSEILSAYQGTGLGNGSGQEMGIIIDAVPLAADLEKFWSIQGIPQSINNITYETISNVSGQPIDAREGEETLDVTWASGLAPAGTVHIFNCQNLYNQNIDAAYSQCATELGNGTRPNMHQLSMSFGGNEEGQSASAFSTDHQYFTTIASYGVSVFASSGDNGAFDNSGNLSVNYPASDPEITGVGGTSLLLTSSGTISSEIGWTTDGNYLEFGGTIGASGGGVSTAFSRPSYQTGSSVPSGTMRLVPDVASSADEDEGALFVFTDPTSGQQEVTSIGGTSWAAPCWNAYLGLLNQKRAALGKASLGFLNGQLYPLLSTSSFRDITTGNNSHYQSSDGYSCKAGYDEVTGLGSPVLANLLTALGGGGGSTLPTITNFTPASGPVGTTVTINGTNFTGLQSVTFNGVSASGNFNATTITATVPSGATTGKIVVTTTAGSVTSATNFTVGSTTAPTITNFTPTSGPVGTSVTINGTNFVGLTSVTFNGVSASGNFNATTITVTVPSGATTGRIVVTGSGGSVTSATNFTVTAGGVPVVTSASSAAGTTGKAFSYQITATNNPTAYGVQGLPGGLAINASTGLISGVPKTAGTYSLTLHPSNAAGKGSGTLTLTVALGVPTVTSATTATGKVGTAFSYQITATGSPTAYGVQGLPGGLTVNASTGLISGTPTVAGTFTMTLHPSNAAGKGSGSLTLTVTGTGGVPVVTGGSSSATVGVAYSYQIEATGSPTRYGVQGLPGGLTVGPTGKITGTPKTAGTYTLTLNAYNDTGKGSATLTLTIAAGGGSF